MYLRWLLPLLLTITTVLGSQCPSKCSCNATYTDCSNRGLVAFPESIPSATKTLNLRSNSIRRLSSADIKGLNNLETLILADNELRTIEQDILNQLPRLQRLVLAKNRLETIPRLSSKSSRLQNADFSRNHISKIDGQAFRGMTYLKTLDLSSNRLQAIPSTLAPSTIRPSVKLHKNPLNCDCRINRVKSMLPISVEEQPICFNPLPVRGQNVSQVYPSACGMPSETAQTMNVRLDCPINDNAIAVVWLQRGEEIEAKTTREYQIVKDSLLISKTQSPLDFQCTYEYAISGQRSLRNAGNYSSSAPTIAFTSKDGAHREGTVVKVHCEVRGEPQPAITWYHNGRMVTPSKKIELHNGGSELKIFPYLQEDTGTYTCQASNIHGHIRHVIRLQLVSSVAPVIHEAPLSKDVDFGDQVTLRCGARGIPAPRISWRFDGVRIPVVQGRYSFSSDSTELYLERITRQDAGTYSCYAENTVGSAMADARVTIRGDLPIKVDAILTKAVLDSIAKQAKENVEKAVANNRKERPNINMDDPEELKKLFKFAVPAATMEVSKSREIYEESIRLVYEYVQKGLNLTTSDLSPNVSYEAIMDVSHVQTLMEVTGCQTGTVFKRDCNDMCFHMKYRTYDGQCNNFEHPLWGMSDMALLRLLPPAYENGFNTPVGWDPKRLYNGYVLPNARDVSRKVIATREITPHTHYSAMMFQWGQFLDHDLTHTATALVRQSYASGALCNKTCENVDPCFNIQLPWDDPKRNTSAHTKFPCIEFERNGAVCGSGETSLIFNRVTYRDQLNILTSYIDGSMVYGSIENQALELRDLYSDHGLLRFDIVSNAQKPYLPFEKDSDMDCRRNFSHENPIRCFLAGDLRANDQIALTALHTIFLREHNRIAGQLLQINVNWDGETIFQETRKIIGAMIQHITYTDWLPLVLGRSGFNEYIGEYGGYNPSVNPTVANEFAAAAFRFGHTIINPLLFRLDGDLKPIKDGHLPLHKAFFAPERLLSEGGIDPLLRGLFAMPMKRPRSDQLLNTELTEKLFSRYHEVALDLAAINIQRGRDHGLPRYIEYRRFCNLSVPTTWEELRLDVEDSDVIERLRSLYGHIGNIDLWVGGVAERRLPDALVGPTFACIIGDQFKRSRDGDRFWYENEGVFSKLQLQQIRKTSLARLFCDNGDDIKNVQSNVFQYVGNSTRFYEKCDNHATLNLQMWAQCCEQTCQAPAAADFERRRKRSMESPCADGALNRVSGSKWNDEENCKTCTCTDGETFCRVNADCERKKRR